MAGRVCTTSRADRANYNWQTDIINLPEKDQFASADAYYATAFHEAGHSTGHKYRLNREPAQHLGGWQFGDKIYAREELVAEMTSALLQADDRDRVGRAAGPVGQLHR